MLDLIVLLVSLSCVSIAALPLGPASTTINECVPSAGRLNMPFIDHFAFLECLFWRLKGSGAGLWLCRLVRVCPRNRCRGDVVGDVDYRWHVSF